MRRIAFSMLIGAALFGCGLSVTGLESVDGGAGDAASESPTRIPEDAGGAPDTGADAIVDSGPPPSSCKEIKQRAPSTVSGKQTIVLPNRGDVSVHCEMQLLGGGFTLVARSGTSGTSASFGWHSPTGSVDNDAPPYAMDATGLAFGEVMIAAWPSSGPPKSGVIVHVPSDFLAAYANAQLDVRTVPNQSVEILGSCDSFDFNQSTQMVRRLGFASQKSFFYIRDVTDLGNFGLFPNGFGLAGGGCARSMDLDGRRGAIWVR